MPEPQGPDAGGAAPSLGVVIPTLNAAASLAATLDAAVALGAAEIVVADGGSTDGTAMLARRRGVRLIEVARGRGGQLAAGAAAITADWLCFLHADTRLDAAAAAALRRHMTACDGPERAGYFRFRLDDDSAAARRLERLVAWRCRVFALPYGDQGLLIARQLFDRIGGYRPLPLMEDVDLVRRLGRRLVRLDGDAVTSAARWRRDGWWLRSARNLGCLTLYFLGVPPGVLLRLYR
ncbi:MAG: glycosyltransferase [Azospirillum sp.]|nr:glycosyltransferase [Azospirillum sp.]